MLFAGPVLAQSGLRLPTQGEPGLDPAFARGWLGPDYDRFGTALHNWREAVGFAPGQRMQWSYTLNDRSSLGMGMANSRELEDQRQLSALRPLLAHAGLGAQRRDAVARSVGPAAACATSASACSAGSEARFFHSKLNSGRSCAWPCSTSTTRCSPATATTSGASSWSTAACSSAQTYEAQNRAFYEQYKAGTLDIHEFLGFALRPLADHAPEELDALAPASS